MDFVRSYFLQNSYFNSYNKIVFFFHKHDITIRFRFSPSSDANWCLTDSQHWEIQVKSWVFTLKGRENLNLKKYNLN